MALNKNQFRYVMGEKLMNKKHPDLISIDEHLTKQSEEGLKGGTIRYGEHWYGGLAYATHDKYGIESVTGGIRGVIDPTGRMIDEVRNVNEAVKVIQEHRSRKK